MQRTHTESTHVPLRCTLLTPSPGPLQRVVVQFSRTRLSDISSLSLSPLTLAYSPCFSPTLSFASRLQDAATTDASVSLPFCSPLYSFLFPLSPSLSSPHFSRSAAERQSSFSKPWSRASLFFQVPGGTRTRKREKEEGREKEERKECWANWPNWCATPGHQRSADSQPASYCRKNKQLHCKAAEAVEASHMF